jgi:hypothetical protein
MLGNLLKELLLQLIAFFGNFISDIIGNLGAIGILILEK